MKGLRFLIILIISLFSHILLGQDVKKEKNWTLSGYLKYMQSANFQDINQDWLTDNLIHNRINFKWYTSKSITMDLELRTRFMYGETVKFWPGYDKLIDVENGFVDLADILVSKKSFLLHSMVDRVWIDYTKGDFQIRLGRQRINWGQTFAWNPNDLFNTYSFFDFDYEEKPGSDAVRIQYYTGMTSHLELAVKANSEDEVTAAGLFQFNKWSYDIQFLGGIFNENDYVVGAGWSGQINDGGFRGEISYFHPIANSEDTSGNIVASMGYDYTFKNSLMLQFEALYNHEGKKGGAFDLEDFYYTPMNAKNISITQFSLFGQASYPLTPLVNTTFSCMYSPNFKFLFLGPTVAVSLKDNLDMSIVAQYFTSEDSKELGGAGTMIYFRLRWSL